MYVCYNIYNIFFNQNTYISLNYASIFWGFAQESKHNYQINYVVLITLDL